MSNNIDKKNLKYFCIFGGGSIRGLSYVGAYKALNEMGIEISGYAGSSVGSIAAAMAALNYDINEITDVFMKFDYALFKDINFSFKLELAISKGEVFTNKIRELIENKLNTDKPIKFKDFPKDLYIITSNLSKGKSFVFSKETTPDFEVAQAIRISTGFPGLMNPYEYNGDYYVDGDLSKAFAIWQLSPLLNPKNTRILEFRLEGAKKQEPTNNPIVFLNNSFDFLSYMATDNICNLYKDYDKYDFIVISTKDTLLFDFSIPQEKREKIIELGYKTTLDYFKNKLPIKKIKLCEIYKKMLTSVKSARKEVNSNNNEKAKLILLDFIFNEGDNYKFLDKSIIEQYEEIVNLFNGKIFKFLFFKFKNSNQANLTSKINYLEKYLNDKIAEMESYISNFGY